jgi:hypothetical protein
MFVTLLHLRRAGWFVARNYGFAPAAPILTKHTNNNGCVDRWVIDHDVHVSLIPSNANWNVDIRTLRVQVDPRVLCS